MEVRRLGKRGEELAGQSERLSVDLLVAKPESSRLAAELVKANESITLLDKNVAIEHEEGFNKAMRQTVFLLKVDPLAVGFDMNQDVCDWVMKSIEDSDGIDFSGVGDRTGTNDDGADNPTNV